MKNSILTLAMVMSTIVAVAQQAPKPYGALPSDRQLRWQETEMYCIVHFSMATFTDKEWGYGDENPVIFNPAHFDAYQIVQAAKSGGFRGIVVVAKHHDGFCLWPTKTTVHNISQSPWRNGKGDIVKEYEFACHKLDMKMGVYCSPWDRSNAAYGKPEYVTEVYRKQLKELYANYGPLFMSWHDGANGGDGFYGGSREPRTIDRSNYYGWEDTWSITRAMQPGAAIFGDIGPDVRWIGNEEGHAGETYWETYTPHAPDPGKKPSNGYSLYQEATEGTRDGKYWIPAECDVPMRSGWFYHQSQDGQSKSAYTLLNLYYNSVGRGACLDLGLSPDKNGQLTAEDAAILKQFGLLLKQTFGVNLAAGATFKASNIRGGNAKKFGPQYLVDNNRYTYWATDDAVTEPELVIDLHSPKTFNVIRLRENIKLGQRIEGVSYDAWLNGTWKEIAAITSVGANKLARLPNNITTSKVRLRVTASPVCIALSDFGLFKEPVHLTSPRIQRGKDGLVTIRTEAPVGSVHYTLDGSAPSLKTPLYTTPFMLESGGLVAAESFDGKAQHSEVSLNKFGLAKTNWKIIGALGRSSDNAIDEDENTFYDAAKPGAEPASLPNDLVIDMGSENLIGTFSYLPRQDKRTDGVVDRYEIDGSLNGKDWTLLTTGEFANIKANPIDQLINLDKPVLTRYIRFRALHVLSGNGISVAEIGAN